jgi:hypothetical protein
MNPKKYLISYDWKEGRDGKFFFHDHYETDSFFMALFMFIALRMRYSTISVDYRR